MQKKSHYVFGAAVAVGGIQGLFGLAHQAHAATLTDFTFETSGLGFSTSVTQGGAEFTAGTAEVGSGTAFGSHAATAAVYSSPAGNGSPHSFSSNNWAPGDYYEFDVDTTGLTGIKLSFDQISSGTGPSQFLLQYSSDGGFSFVTVGTYSISSVGAASSFWSNNPTASQAAYNHAFNLSAFTDLNNNPDAIFQLVDNGTTPFASSITFTVSTTTGTFTGTQGTGTGGTDRVDNFLVTTVPEPAAVSLLTVAAAALLGRRRSKE
jgi:hypothetical protein